MRVVVADDALVTREGVVRLLTEAGVEVVGQAEDADGLLRQVRVHRPDLAIVDIRMPPTRTDEGLAAAQQIRATVPETRVLVLSSYIEPAYALRLLEDGAGGAGYLLKDRISDVAVLIDAMRRVIAGETVVDPAIVTRLMTQRRRLDPLDVLSDREREVLELLAEGRSNAGIARYLVIAERTVETHVKRIFAKLDLDAGPDANRRVLAVLTFLRAAR